MTCTRLCMYIAKQSISESDIMLRLDVFPYIDRKKQGVHLTAFPMGVTGNGLSKHGSMLWYHYTDNVTINPLSIVTIWE